MVLIRLPFLTQAIQGDDVYYIFGAQHALIDPAHPTHAKYILHGDMVDMRGHPHPPLNSWVLAALIAIFGDVYEAPFHAAYVVFSLIAVAAMWSLAKRWSPFPFAATLLFIAVPAFMVNGNSLEADVPFLAWWLAGIALFLSGRLVWAAGALALAAMTAYQAVVATPVLWVWCWFHARRSKAAWAVALTPVMVVGAYQLYERLTGGALPATVLAGYFSAYGLQQLANKLRNAAALTAHTGWIVFPVAAIAAFRRRWPVLVLACVAGAFVDPHPLFWLSFGTGALVVAACIRKPDFLTAWVLIFFAAALALFFAGASRYLLPMAAPVVLLIARELKRPWLVAAGVANLALGLALAWVSWDHWDGYRQFVRSMPFDTRTWMNGELGMRFYAETEGALPVSFKQPVQAGDWVLSTELGFALPLAAPLSPVKEQEIRPTLPLRLLGLNAKSAFSTSAFGLRPFDITTEPADRMRAHVVRQRKATLTWLPMNAPEAEEHILSGIFQLEGTLRWFSGRAVVALAEPAQPRPLEVQIYLHPMAPARHVRVLVDGGVVHEQELPGPNLYTIRTPPVKGTTVAIELDKTFRPQGDSRDLGAVLFALGYR